jgi:hypothetical protein
MLTGEKTLPSGPASPAKTIRGPVRGGGLGVRLAVGVGGTCVNRRNSVRSAGVTAPSSLTSAHAHWSAVLRPNKHLTRVSMSSAPTLPSQLTSPGTWADAAWLTTAHSAAMPTTRRQKRVVVFLMPPSWRKNPATMPVGPYAVNTEAAAPSRHHLLPGPDPNWYKHFYGRARWREKRWPERPERAKFYLGYRAA